MFKSRFSILCVAFTLLFHLNSVGQTSEKYIVLDGITGKAHVLSASDNAEISAIQSGATANSIAISPNGRLAFVANLNGQFVSVIDLTIQNEIRRIRGVRADQI